MNNIIIQDQYRNTNIETLINGIISIREKHRVKALEALRDDVINLKTAKGDALDLWGRLLKFSRFIPIDTQEGVETFKNFTFYDRNLNRLKFYSINDVVYAKLTDGAYRKVLQIIYYNINVYSNIYNASELASVIFENNIFVGDSQDMSYITYFFRNEIPQWLSWILSKYDILPRPVCVGTRFQSVNWKVFGFITNDANYNAKVASFYNSQFLGNRDPNNASGSTPIAPPYNVTGIVEPKLFNFGKGNNTTQNFYGAMFYKDDAPPHLNLKKIFTLSDTKIRYNNTTQNFYGAMFYKE